MKNNLSKYKSNWTNLEIFLVIVGISCLVLGVGYKNIILGSISLLAFFSVIAKRILTLHNAKQDVEFK